MSTLTEDLPVVSDLLPDDRHHILDHHPWASQHLERAALVLVQTNQQHLADVIKNQKQKCMRATKSVDHLSHFLLLLSDQPDQYQLNVLAVKQL